MRAGSLRHKIVIQAPSSVKEKGVTSVSWVQFRKVSASIEQMKAFDKAQAQAVYPGADYVIGIRYIAGLTANMRIVDAEGFVYSICGQPNDVDGRHREMILTCQRGVKAT